MEWAHIVIIKRNKALVKLLNLIIFNRNTKKQVNIYFKFSFSHT